MNSSRSISPTILQTDAASVEDARKLYADSMMAMMKQNKKNECLRGSETPLFREA